MLLLVFLYKETNFLFWPSQVKRIFLLQAFSAFYFVMNFLNLTSESSPLALNKVTSTIESFCARPWQEVSCACCSRLGQLILFCGINGCGNFQSKMGKIPPALAVDAQAQAGAVGRYA